MLGPLFRFATIMLNDVSARKELEDWMLTIYENEYLSK